MWQLIVHLGYTCQDICIGCYPSLTEPPSVGTCLLIHTLFWLTDSQCHQVSQPVQPETPSMLFQNPGQQLSSSLDVDVHFYRTNSFAPSTSKTYSVHQLTYLDFCTKIGIAPVPISQADLGRYIAYLSRKLSFSSIRQYLNIVRLLHLENGHANPLSNNWYITSILKGVWRVKGDACAQKLPITLELLRSIFLTLNLHSSFDRAFWAACLVGFFLLF